MPDNWGFVAAAYGLTAIVLGLYWRRLVKREKDIAAAVGTRGRAASRSSHPRP